MKNNSLIFVIVASVCFFFAALAVGIFYYQAKKPSKTVSVVGLAEKDFVSDLIVWNLSYDVTDMDMKCAYNAIKNQNVVVKKFLKDKGIEDDEVDFMSISTMPQYDYHWDNEQGRSVEMFKGYQARQSVRVKSKDVDKIERIIRGISDLYDQNIKILSEDPEYYYTKLSELKMEMLAEASQNARDRAETITKNAGGKLGNLKTATTGVFQITAPNSSEDSYSWSGAYNTSSKQKRVSINMRLTYYVK